MANKEVALSYLNKGISVIPIWSPKTTGNKPSESLRGEFKKENK